MRHTRHTIKYLSFIWLCLLSQAVFASPTTKTIDEILKHEYTDEDAKEYFKEYEGMLRQNSKEEILSLDVGKFKLNDEIGRGSFAKVYDISPSVNLTENVALKLPQASGEYNNILSQKWYMKEVELLRQLDHPNIISLSYPKSKLIIMEIADGILEDVVGSVREVSNEAMFKKITKDFLSGILYLEEQGIVYTDIHFRNIVYIISKDSNDISFKIIDLLHIFKKRVTVEGEVKKFLSGLVSKMFADDSSVLYYSDIIENASNIKDLRDNITPLTENEKALLQTRVKFLKDESTQVKYNRKIMRRVRIAKDYHIVSYSPYHTLSHSRDIEEKPCK